MIDDDPPFGTEALGFKNASYGCAIIILPWLIAGLFGYILFWR